MKTIAHAEPVPSEAATEVLAMLQNGDLFRYTADATSPVTRLEKEFARFMGVPFALAVNSCSSAIFLSLKALGLGSGESVLVPAFTFAAVPSSVVHAGCKPVLVNTGPDLRLDMDDFRRKLTCGIRAVVLSHMRGHTSDMDAIMEACQDNHVPIVEDAAHSLGTTWSGRKIGTFGRVGCFSFQSYKLINAGEGGMLITSDPDLVARAIIMSGAYEHNWKKHAIVNARFIQYQNKLPLFGLRMSNLTAAVALSQLPDAPRRAQNGRENHDYLAAKLTASGLFQVPEPLPQEVRAPDSIQFLLDVRCDNAEDATVFQHLVEKKGVNVQIFGHSRDNARAFWNWRFLEEQKGLSQTRKVLMRTCDVRLPVHLQKAELDHIAGALVEAAQAVAPERRSMCRQTSAENVIDRVETMNDSTTGQQATGLG